MSDEKLAGDKAEEILSKFGADELASLYEEMTGNDCGCDKRKEWLNDIHRKVRDWFKNMLTW